MNRFNIQITPLFMLYALFAASALTAAPSKEVTEQLTVELQDIRKNLAQEAIEIFQDKDQLPNAPWPAGALCRAIVSEDKPATDLDLLVGDIGRVVGSLDGVINYSYSQMAERILRMQLYYNRFARSAIPYISASNTHAHLVTEYRALLAYDTNSEKCFIDRHTRAIDIRRLTTMEDQLDRTMYSFSDLTCMLADNQTTGTKASASPIKSRKRAISDDSDEDEEITKDPKRVHIDENHSDDDDSDEDTKAVQPVAQPVPPKMPGLLTLLRSRAHDTNIIRQRSNIVAQQEIRDNFLKKESQEIALTMLLQTQVRQEDGIILANNHTERLYLQRMANRLREPISHAKEPTHAFFTISTAQKISAIISDLEANHVNPHARNVTRIKQWQTHYQNILRMGLLFLNSITAEKPDQVTQRDMLIHCFTRDLGVDVIPTLPAEDPGSSTDIQKMMDLQRITLANKTTRALTGIQKMQKMLYLYTEQSDDHDDSEDDDNNNNT